MTQPPSVLLADDDARDAAGMARALRDAGFVVAIESEARRLLRRLERERPHLLVIDADCRRSPETAGIWTGCVMAG